MLLVVNVARRAVLALVDRAAIGAGQVAAVCLTIRSSLAVNALLLVFEPRRLTGGQLPAANALRDAVLLVFLTLADFARAIVLHGGIVLIVVDLVRQVILLLRLTL